MTVSCETCAAEPQCTRTPKVASEQCWMDRAGLGKCPGCGMVRSRFVAEKVPCAMCATLAGMSADQQAIVRKRLADHEAMYGGATA